MKGRGCRRHGANVAGKPNSPKAKRAVDAAKPHNPETEAQHRYMACGSVG